MQEHQSARVKVRINHALDVDTRQVRHGGINEVVIKQTIGEFVGIIEDDTIERVAQQRPVGYRGSGVHGKRLVVHTIESGIENRVVAQDKIFDIEDFRFAAVVVRGLIVVAVCQRQLGALDQFEGLDSPGIRPEVRNILNPNQAWLTGWIFAEYIFASEFEEASWHITLALLGCDEYANVFNRAGEHRRLYVDVPVAFRIDVVVEEYCGILKRDLPVWNHYIGCEYVAGDDRIAFEYGASDINGCSCQRAGIPDDKQAVALDRAPHAGSVIIGQVDESVFLDGEVLAGGDKNPAEPLHDGVSGYHSVFHLQSGIEVYLKVAVADDTIGYD